MKAENPRTGDFIPAIVFWQKRREFGKVNILSLIRIEAWLSGS
jgi:hypothetical protein